MVYNFFISIFYTITLFLNFLFSGQAGGDVFVPSEVEAGQRFLVTVTLNKESLSGFARYQQKLPHGLIATPNQSANAEFSFKNHKVKFVWYGLPEEDQFTISYFLEVDQRVKGSFKLGGMFSFIADNERRSASLSDQSIYITPSPVAEYSIDINEFREDFDYTIPPPREDLIACIRQKPFFDEPSGQYKVNLLVYKKDQKKFAKIEENVPGGLSAVAKESQDPIFTFNNNVAKYIWMNLPPDPYFVVSYNIVDANMGTGDINLDGKFSYVEDDKTLTVEIIELDNIDLSNTDLAYLQNIIESAYEQIAKAKRSTEVNQTIEEKQPVAESEELTPILDPEEGVYYRVQLAAGHNPVDITKYFRKYNLKHEVKSEKHDGWIKYSIGAFPIYKEARDYRVHVWNTTTIDDAFVAAYNNGMRITVQEALMIANHKWYR